MSNLIVWFRSQQIVGVRPISKIILDWFTHFPWTFFFHLEIPLSDNGLWRIWSLLLPVQNENSEKFTALIGMERSVDICRLMHGLGRWAILSLWYLYGFLCPWTVGSKKFGMKRDPSFFNLMVNLSQLQYYYQNMAKVHIQIMVLGCTFEKQKTLNLNKEPCSKSW